MQEEDVPLFGLAFRPFFLFGTLFSVVAMATWVSIVNGWWDKDLYGGSFFWHVHEMLFGFVAAIIVGFLLTAAQNWTGMRTLHGFPLAIISILWLTARVGFFFMDTGSIWLATIDISFLLVVAVFLGAPIVKVRQWRNLFFVPVLILFSVANGMMHLGALNQDHALVLQGTRGALFLVCVLMVTVGGRVIPGFTANGTGTQGVAPIPGIEIMALGSVWLLMFVFLLGLDSYLTNLTLSALLILAAASNLARWVRWRFWITFRVPLVWTLHIAYFFIVAGFTALAVSYLIVSVAPSVAWHLITVGGMGGLILSMVSRVSLGHTGRMIVAPRWMVPAFICIFIAAVLRGVFPATVAEYYVIWVTASGLLWIAAFSVFVIGYFSILSQPRVDGRPG
ncbi:MAG: NnrS family protein [Pseudomonadales bacterium]